MAAETVGRKINELRVYDLKSELETRNLSTQGNKVELVKRLQQALTEEGKNPEEYLFEISDKKPSPAKKMNAQRSSKSNGQEEEDGDTDVNQDDVDELVVKDEVEDGDEIVDEVGEVDKENFVEGHRFNESTRNVSHDASNADNEDSLNLTIGEDEEKIFQDEESDIKIKEKVDSRADKNEKKDSKANDTVAADRKISNSTSGSKQTVENGDEKASVADKKDDSEKSSNKKDDSDQKTSSAKTSSKDDKESSSKASASKSKSSSSSSSSASRNLWVSGLSSLTRATDLKIIFSKYGKVIGAKVVTNTRTPGTRCYGYVTMGSSSDASKCIEHLHRTELHGRIISVERAKSEMGIVVKPPAPTTKTDGKVPPEEATKSSTGSSDRKKTEKEPPKDVKEKDATVKAEDESKIDDKKKRPEVDRKPPKENPLPQRQRITARVSRDRVDTAAAAARRAKGRPIGDKEREVLSFQKIREERERQRLRERERKLREEERRRQESRRRQRDEEERLVRERERLKKERIRLEREKADLLRLERERQKLEREKIELERLELKRQQLKIEEAKRAIKRPSEHDRYPEVDRKRPATDRRFEPPPPPRFDTSISSRPAPYENRATEKKRIDEYTVQKREDYKRDDYKRETFKRPVVDYPKRAEIEPTRSSNSYDSRSVPVHRGGEPPSSKDRYGIPSSDNRPSNNFGGGSRSSGGGGGTSSSRDERDPRGMNSKRYMESGSTGDSRYVERGGPSSSAWPNTGPPPVKPFGHMQSVAANDPWGQKQSDASWRSMDQNQDRYDRTYNERKSQATPAQYMDPPRQNSFIGRPQDRYNNTISSRFENGRF